MHPETTPLPASNNPMRVLAEAALRRPTFNGSGPTLELRDGQTWTLRVPRVFFHKHRWRWFWSGTADPRTEAIWSSRFNARFNQFCEGDQPDDPHGLADLLRFGWWSIGLNYKLADLGPGGRRRLLGRVDQPDELGQRIALDVLRLLVLGPYVDAHEQLDHQFLALRARRAATPLAPSTPSERPL